MKQSYIKTFEAFNTVLDPRIVTLNKYLYSSMRPLSNAVCKIDNFGLLTINSNINIDPKLVDFESLEELNLGHYQVNGSFLICRLNTVNKQLKNLKGLPSNVDLLDVSSNGLLTLEGGENTTVKSKFICNFNRQLLNLIGMPNNVGTWTMLNINSSLESLEGFNGGQTVALIGDNALTDISALTEDVTKVVISKDMASTLKFPTHVKVVIDDAN